MMALMHVLTEADPELDPDISSGDTVGTTRAALELGLPVHFLPRVGSPGSEDDVLGGLAPVAQPGPTVWLGYIPTPERYAQVFEAARERGLHLLNDPEAHLRALEFPRAWPHLRGLTPDSQVIESPAQVEEALDVLGLPVFIKGTVLSRKSYGWKACVAETREEARTLAEKLLRTARFSRERVVLRRFVPLRRTGEVMEGFPCSREYRLFLLRDEVVGEGYYWPFGDPFGPLTPAELEQVRGLAREAARRLAVPLLAVDVAQAEDGSWLVIEVGDPQFAGLSHISPRGFIQRLHAVLAGA
jgi:hypothetical protein